jgi:hypothetical protein
LPEHDTLLRIILDWPEHNSPVERHHVDRILNRDGDERSSACPERPACNRVER